MGFRLAALAVGLVPLLALEGLCRVAGWGRPQAGDDPFVGFSATRPLFVLSDDGERYEIAPGRRSHFQPDSFAAHKPPDEFRIFCLGGSTVQGRPFSIETSFTSWLELSLRAADPRRRWRVVNCGGVSYATYRLAPILQEVLNYQPDLVIFYEGHNEFLEDRTYARLKHAPRWLVRAQELASGWRTYNVLREAVWPAGERAAAPQTVLGPEVDARLDWHEGLAAYHRDPAWQQECIAHFEFNLRRIVALARSRGVRLVLVNPVSNLDWPPFKAEHASDLDPQQLAEVRRLWEAARGCYRTDQARAARLLEQAVAIDDQHAGLQFDLGQCYLNLGRLDEARQALLRAKDLDICPLRILQPMNAIVLRVAGETGTPLVDADALFREVSPGGITGPKWFADHVHPTIAGHQLLADALAEELVRQGMFEPRSDWAAQRRRLYEEHLAALPATYFPDSELRLRGEQNWAHGGSTRRRPPPRPAAAAQP